MRKIMHRLYAKFICFFESHALTVLCMGLVQTVKSPKGLSGKICPRKIPRVIRLSGGVQPPREILIPEGPP